MNDNYRPFTADYNTREQCWDLRERGKEPRQLSTPEFEIFLRSIEKNDHL